MKIALLGGSGFIGKEFIRQFGTSHDIRIGDIEKSETYPELWNNCDIRNKDQLREFVKDSDVIINLAAVHRDDVKPLSLYFDTNVLGSQNICEVAEELGIQHQIFTSSVAVYGFQDDAPDEAAPHRYFNTYGETKSKAEEIYNEWAHKGKDRTMTIIRPTVVFGPDNRGNVYNLLRQIASGAFLMIGNGKNRKSMCYVGNISAFIGHALGFKPGLEVYNYIDKPDFEMNELVTLVRSTIGKGDGVGLRLPYWLGHLAGLGFDTLSFISRRNFPISLIRIQKFCSNSIFSAEKAHAACGFKAPYDLRTALIDTIVHEFPKKAS
jgi:nucleoside-diphosphate-sugar epimerase